jgi:hypothetical protein
MMTLTKKRATVSIPKKTKKTVVLKLTPAEKQEFEKKTGLKSDTFEVSLEQLAELANLICN